MPLSMQLLPEIGKKNGFDVVATKDLAFLFPAELKAYDAVVFYTTGELPIGDAEKANLLAWIKSGKGFIGIHCATDTFYKWADYGDMIGGYFDEHPWHQEVKVKVEDAEYAGDERAAESVGAHRRDLPVQGLGPYEASRAAVARHLVGGSTKKGVQAHRWGLRQRLDEDVRQGPRLLLGTRPSSRAVADARSTRHSSPAASAGRSASRIDDCSCGGGPSGPLCD